MVAKLILVFGGLWLLLVVALWRLAPEIRRYLEKRQEEETKRERLQSERVDKLVDEAESSVYGGDGGEDGDGGDPPAEGETAEE